ncbi:MAG: GNAT family N-acetyltransferase [Acidimicrobiales bacterium]|jgi:GNAT superfamily N-acetyltransferase
MIRHLEEADHDRWRELWDGYLHFYRSEVPEDVTADTFGRLCDDRDGLVGLVAVGDDAKVAGFAHLVFHASTWTDSCYCYLEDLFVDPELRGTGSARQLIEAVYAEADRRGATHTYWHTQEYNSPARSLYDVVGRRTSFVVYER